MVELVFSTPCGHNGSIQTQEEGDWTWQCRGPNVKDPSGVHEGISKGNRLYVKIAISRSLDIPMDTIQLKLKRAVPRPRSKSKPRPALSGPTIQHKLEWSPNRRAHCRMCGGRIERGELRVGIDAPFGTGSDKLHHHHYYHQDCCSDDTKKRLLGLPNYDQLEQKWAQSLTAMEEQRRKKAQILHSDRAELRRRLHSLRLRLLEEQGHKADGQVRILSRQTMDNVVVAAPTTMEELLRVKGIGTHMLESYGAALLEEVGKFLTEPKPPQVQARPMGARSGTIII